MDLDWYSEEEVKNAQLFNDESIIVSKITEKKETDDDLPQTKKDSIEIENCFKIITECKNSKQLLIVLQYLSGVANHLRNLIRSKCIKTNENACTHSFSKEELDSILKYLNWLKNTSDNLKILFIAPLRKDNSFDPHSIKPFKTSSYKFCNYSDLCLVHKNKNKNCDKNHFVFEMIINDITKLIESLNILGLDNLNWVFLNKYLLTEFDNETKKYSVVQADTQVSIVDQESQFQVDKNLICKSFDVISFVLNKMYDEATSFLNSNNKSLLINL